MCPSQTAQTFRRCVMSYFKEREWRTLITKIKQIRSEKNNLPLYVQVENLLQLYYQNMFCRERRLSKYLHLVKHFSNDCCGLLCHNNLTVN